MMRSRYTISEKLKLVESIELLTTVGTLGEDGNVVEGPISIRQACARSKCLPSTYRKWKKQLPLLKGYKLNKQSTKYRMHRGRPPFVVNDIEEELVEWLLLKREVGQCVTYRMMIRKLCKIDPRFRFKSDNAQHLVIKRLSKRNKFVYRAATHTAQRLPEEVKEEAKAFVADTIPIFAQCDNGQRHKDYIINMDQTPVFFNMSSKYTLELLGERSVNVRASKNEGSTSRATVFLSVTASGKFLKSLVVFRGTANGRVSKEFDEYDKGALYQAQEKAWCDERVMLYWIENILRPYIADMPNIPENPIRPVLMLDRYSCHLMDTVKTQIADLGIDVLYVPGGCTSLAQPLDVGINKPFKDRIRAKWNVWMEHQTEMHGEDYQPKVPRWLVARWIVKATRDINEAIGQNAWKHGPYSYFP